MCRLPCGTASAAVPHQQSAGNVLLLLSVPFKVLVRSWVSPPGGNACTAPARRARDSNSAADLSLPLPDRFRIANFRLKVVHPSGTNESGPPPELSWNTRHEGFRVHCRADIPSQATEHSTGLGSPRLPPLRSGPATGPGPAKFASPWSRGRGDPVRHSALATPNQTRHIPTRFLTGL